MIGIEVYEMLEQVCSSHDAYYDVMDCDALRFVRVPKFPMALVVNTRPAPESGHWIAFYMRDEYSPIEFFDTFKMPPEVYNNNFVPFMRRMSHQILDMPRTIQCQDSAFCGHHCINYINSRLQRKSIEYIYTKIFSPGCRNKDTSSKRFVNSMKPKRFVHY